MFGLFHTFTVAYHSMCRCFTYIRFFCLCHFYILSAITLRSIFSLATLYVQNIRTTLVQYHIGTIFSFCFPVVGSSGISLQNYELIPF